MAKARKANSNKQYSLKTKATASQNARPSFLTNGQAVLQSLETQLNLNQSYISLIVGLVIVLVVGVLVLTHLKKQTESNLGPAQQTTSQKQIQNSDKNISASNLPEKYTVKEGDTLFEIARNYYQDGYKYPLIASANKLTNADLITPGQVLDIPSSDSSNRSDNSNTALGTGGSESQTIWGEKITENTYTVQKGDWLSKIAGRAYGDIYQFEKIAKANNITDPNNLEVGTVLKIPR